MFFMSVTQLHLFLYNFVALHTKKWILTSNMRRGQITSESYILYYQLDFVTHFQISVIKNVLWSYLPMQICSSSHLLSTVLPTCAQYIYNMHRSELFSVMPLHFMWILVHTISLQHWNYRFHWLQSELQPYIHKV